MKGPEMKVDRMLGEPEGTLLDETGEMSQRDIEPGGEHYEWAQAIEAAAKEVERLTDGAFKFKEMRPFDKYQGPYARVLLPDGGGASLWDAQSYEGGTELFLDGPDYVGTPEELAPALLGDEEAIRIVKARYVAVQEPTESQGAPQDEIESAVDRMFEQEPEGAVESRWSRAASTDDQEKAIVELERLLSKLGKRIVGGTTIGKHPQTVVLDLTHQGSEIYIDDTGEVRINGEPVEMDLEDVRALLGEEPGESRTDPVEQAVDRMLEQDDTPVEEAGKCRAAPPPELSESVEAVGRFLAKAARTIKGLDHTYPDLGFGDTPTDEEIADVFRRMLKGKRVRRPDYGFLYLGDEPSAAEKAQIAAATRKVTEILDALVIDIDNEMDVKFTPSIIDWLVEEFYGILHGGI